MAKTHCVSFTVTVCLGGGDGGDVQVAVNASEAEYALLRENGGDPECEGLEDLTERILEAAQSEASFLMGEYSPDEEFDADRADYIIRPTNDI